MGNDSAIDTFSSFTLSSLYLKCAVLIKILRWTGAVANLRGCGKEAASILFWVHIFAVISMAGWIILYLNILF